MKNPISIYDLKKKKKNLQKAGIPQQNKSHI